MIYYGLKFNYFVPAKYPEFVKTCYKIFANKDPGIVFFAPRTDRIKRKVKIDLRKLKGSLPINLQLEKKKPKKSMFDEPCRGCGAIFPGDGQSFEFEKDKKPICFNCKIKRLPKKTLVTALSILAKC